MLPNHEMLFGFCACLHMSSWALYQHGSHQPWLGQRGDRVWSYNSALNLQRAWSNQSSSNSAWLHQNINHLHLCISKTGNGRKRIRSKNQSSYEFRWLFETVNKSLREWIIVITSICQVCWCKCVQKMLVWMIWWQIKEIHPWNH